MTQNPDVEGNKNPDRRVEGKIFAVYSPSTGSVRNIWTDSQGNVLSGQADRLVLKLEDSTVSIEALKQQFAEWPIEGLNEIIVLRGKVIPVFP